MTREILDLILALGAVVAGLCVAGICTIGFVVWLAGGRQHDEREKTA